MKRNIYFFKFPQCQAIESGSATTGDVITDDLMNVVEIYDFPADYKTDDLVIRVKNQLPVSSTRLQNGPWIFFATFTW
jgi:hypothetical protein